MGQVLSVISQREALLKALRANLRNIRSTQDIKKLLMQLQPRYRLRILLSFGIVVSSLVGGIGYNLWRHWYEAYRNPPLYSGEVDQTSRSRSSDIKEVVFQSNGKERKIHVRYTPQSVFDAHKRLFLGSEGQKVLAGTTKSLSAGRFLKQFIAIWSIMVPRLRSKATGLLVLHALFLSLRTWLSLLVADLDGQLVRDLIAGQGKNFIKGIGLWFLLAIPASYTNSMIKFVQVKIAIAFRTKLARYVHDIYLDSQLAFYKVPDIDGGIEGADQYMTADITRFCDAVASLYSSLGKPSVDFLIFSYQLYRRLGPFAIMGIFANYGLTAWLLQHVAPPFGKLAATQAQLEGDYRNAHTRLIMNAEEIAFYEGGPLEQAVLRKTFGNLISHVAEILKIRVSYNMFEDFLLKYSWSAWGYMFASIPVFLPTWTKSSRNLLEYSPSDSGTSDVSERARMKDFITNKRLMLSLADAGGRMMYSIKDIAELGGHTIRVFHLLATLHRVHANAYSTDGEIKSFSLTDVKGTVQENYNGVRLEHTPIAVPGLGRDLNAGELLIKDLDIKIDPGEHLLITGSNGVGKTSIARVLAGLWPAFRGLVSRPSSGDIHFLPQRPYLSSGTLREQFIYPYTYSQMIEMGKTDDDLTEILKLVKLEYIPSREGGWETVKQWKDVFSGGEKQRVMFARILFENPKFAVIDEGTSAVSADVEGILYEVCMKAGITIITISHRVQLVKYHKAMLRVGLGDDGTDWQFERTGSTNARLSAEAEIKALQEELSHVQEWKARREQVTELLSH